MTKRIACWLFQLSFSLSSRIRVCQAVLMGKDLVAYKPQAFLAESAHKPRPSGFVRTSSERGP